MEEGLLRVRIKDSMRESNLSQCSAKSNANVRSPHHGSEELPVSKVHVHLFLQLVDVALRQNSAVHVGLTTYTKELNSEQRHTPRRFHRCTTD